MPRVHFRCCPLQRSHFPLPSLPMFRDTSASTRLALQCLRAGVMWSREAPPVMCLAGGAPTLPRRLPRRARRRQRLSRAVATPLVVHHQVVVVTVVAVAVAVASLQVASPPVAKPRLHRIGPRSWQHLSDGTSPAVNVVTAVRVAQPCVFVAHAVLRLGTAAAAPAAAPASAHAGSDPPAASAPPMNMDLKLLQMQELGFDRASALAALQQTHGDVDRAASLLS